jgi:hypothetical protein
MKTRALLMAAMLAVTMVVAAAPAGAQVQEQGLVNVAITDTTVQVPVGIAANICGVAVNVLATAANVGDVECTAEGVAIAEHENGNGGPVMQEGLVNIAVTNTTIQVPVAVAANVCGVAVKRARARHELRRCPVHSRGRLARVPGLAAISLHSWKGGPSRPPFVVEE